jgi:hypothetical protein
LRASERNFIYLLVKETLELVKAKTLKLPIKANSITNVLPDFIKFLGNLGSDHTMP